jgi:hypothetical protein
LAAKYAESYRAAGHEVVILAKGLPKSVSPSDYEKLLEIYLKTAAAKCWTCGFVLFAQTGA